MGMRDARGSCAASDGFSVAGVLVANLDAVMLFGQVVFSAHLLEALVEQGHAVGGLHAAEVGDELDFRLSAKPRRPEFCDRADHLPVLMGDLRGITARPVGCFDSGFGF